MTKTSKTETNTVTSSVDEELAATDEKIRTLETEAAELAEISWGELAEASVEESEDKERKRSVLSRLITAAKIRRLELLKVREGRMAEPFEKAREAAGKRIEKAEAARLEIEEELEDARGEHADARARAEKKRRHIKEIDREIASLKEGA